ncbi:DEAD/DEAH box helicase [Citricoccus sp. K5]|uniref:DEAD/DEAH box helicase n=1 Tax=Citricoccus sp. K5 TaxID=2653135 RepID=UPI0013591A17|nr:DEAD/DEAH box helicase [Citricoccus sp. K5]
MTPEQKIAADNDIDTEDLATSEIETIEVEDSIDIAEANEPVAEKTFADFKVRADMVEALTEKGITHPFPIQAMTLPIALGGHDIIGQAKTGTGKTLGFGLPALQRVVGPGEPGFDRLDSPGAPQALIVAPTRELANQVAQDITTAASKRSVRIATIYGGRAYEPQIEELQRGVEVVVGTPGRLIDLMRQRHLNLKLVKIVVLDEADEMLDLGFLPDVETLLSAVPEVRQTMLFSATMPGPVVAMARRYMTQPTHIRAADPDDEGITKKDIRQLVYRAHHMDKDELVARVLRAEGRGKTIIFTRTKRTAARVSDELAKRGFAAGAIHGDLGQGAREQALRAFRGDKVDVLVATDVAARGIDVDDVTHVINFQCPEDEKTYLHRVGRTGRAGNKGTAVTLVDWEDMPRWGLINKALGLDVPEPPETYSSSKHFFEDLNIPKGSKGRLPRDQRTKSGLESETLEDLGGPGAKSDTRGDRGGRGRGDREGGRDGGRSGRGGRGGRDGGREGGRDGSGGRGRSGEGRERSGESRGDRGPRAGDQRDDRAPREGDSGETRSPGTGRRRGTADASGAASEGGVTRSRSRSRSRTRRKNGNVVQGGAGGEATGGQAPSGE